MKKPNAFAEKGCVVNRCTATHLRSLAMSLQGVWPFWAVPFCVSSMKVWSTSLQFCELNVIAYVITASTDCQCNHTLQPVTQLLTSVRSFFTTCCPGATKVLEGRNSTLPSETRIPGIAINVPGISGISGLLVLCSESLCPLCLSETWQVWEVFDPCSLEFD